jgi:hypothetical protein
MPENERKRKRERNREQERERERRKRERDKRKRERDVLSHKVICNQSNFYIICRVYLALYVIVSYNNYSKNNEQNMFQKF